jgi:hypothetical protein
MEGDYHRILVIVCVQRLIFWDGSTKVVSWRTLFSEEIKIPLNRARGSPLRREQRAVSAMGVLSSINVRGSFGR